MLQPLPVLCTHPAGERFFSPPSRHPAWPVDTPGGRYYAEFDDQAPVTREGQLILFAQFLHSGGRWRRLLESCPLRYHGNRGSQLVDVLGTAALSILCGHWRYAHINSVCGDALNPPLLGMTRAVSEDQIVGTAFSPPCAVGAFAPGRGCVRRLEPARGRRLPAPPCVRSAGAAPSAPPLRGQSFVLFTHAAAKCGGRDMDSRTSPLASMSSERVGTIVAGQPGVRRVSAVTRAFPFQQSDPVRLAAEFPSSTEAARERDPRRRGGRRLGQRRDTRWA